MSWATSTHSYSQALAAIVDHTLKDGTLAARGEHGDDASQQNLPGGYALNRYRPTMVAKAERR
jgi:hypothetical protein